MPFQKGKKKEYRGTEKTNKKKREPDDSIILEEKA